MERQRFLILTFSEITKDPRILRIIETVKARGHEIRICYVDFRGGTEEERFKDCNILRIKPEALRCEKNSKNSSFSPSLGDFVSIAWPDLLGCENGGWRKRFGGNLFRGAVSVFKRLKGIGIVGSKVVSRIPTRLRDLAIARQNLYLNLEMVRVNEGWATHIYANDLETLPAGVELKLRDQAKLIYDAHEIWPQQWKPGDKSAEFVGFFEMWERHLLQFVDESVTVCESIARYYSYTCPGSDFTPVQSAPSRTLVCDEDAICIGEISLYYHGIYAAGRGLEMVVSSLCLIEDVKLYIRAVGDLAELRMAIDRYGVGDRVVILDPVAVTDLVAAATGYTIALCPFLNDCLNTHYCLPNKFFEYLLAGCALCVAELVEMKSLVESGNLGRCFEPGDRDSFARTVNEMISDPDNLLEMRKNARKAALGKLNWEANLPLLEGVFERVGL